ncbi:MAG: HIT family protein [Propionibacteriaceae bacterium]|nr:HIT family protein [Propionibacteriaceae bacterium]
MTDVFCQVATGELIVPEIYRDPLVVAFLDHRPVFRGHVLVIPVRHVDTIVDLPAELMEPLFSTAQRVAAAMPTALGAQGSFVAVNNVVSQSVPHLHVHVVPRSKGDGLRGFFWPRTKYADGEAESYAARLREALGGNTGAAGRLEHP